MFTMLSSIEQGDVCRCLVGEAAGLPSLPFPSSRLVFYCLNGSGDRLRPGLFMGRLRASGLTKLKKSEPIRIHALITSLHLHTDSVSSCIMPAICFEQLFLVNSRFEHRNQITTDVTIQNGASTSPCSTKNHCTPREISNRPSCWILCSVFHPAMT